MSMYVRVKRKKTTVFLHVEPTETILEVKQKLQELLEQPPEKQQLFKNNVPLEDAKKLADLRVENDDVLALTFLQDDGTFEAIDITSQNE
mmetsp:Transcript_2449/g.4107  ORF Transcript_2449/g.4107 Transcript_2449/m.4107 type:complete len:90 (+) Transcript_2449:197-466(+)|eukprot:CAMPEP_0119104402 /NCGR_PEP_ID=MMETSP1180-20130426/2620_1 /TAXON_ID=3052 ORGANISM="Chlamydomonas cf sp, Strain CCMP681" /NCGR_SAMPLE_ID=MMETSP1180 /ASSEMBLY_ACC=CAM_ASM_000741 /LENGTH=89 /DNA_ID=CAMNT_0007089147 /DNA_START=174 /DNA_END=443 /DNA_ORIENTATION=-